MHLMWPLGVINVFDIDFNHYVYTHTHARSSKTFYFLQEGGLWAAAKEEQTGFIGLGLCLESQPTRK